MLLMLLVATRWAALVAVQGLLKLSFADVVVVVASTLEISCLCRLSQNAVELKFSL
jgi:hypothetical protein